MLFVAWSFQLPDVGLESILKIHTGLSACLLMSMQGLPTSKTLVLHEKFSGISSKRETHECTSNDGNWQHAKNPRQRVCLQPPPQ